ncbi:MAG: hypothetical protein M1823_001441 [Watsoniomyces obsoletus]|nr:MAG: hypothetical protein M1823_001441 [Watsoniomyces obsoletus]
MDRQLWLTYRNQLTELLYKNPYDLVLFLERALAYKRLGYHDLAVGDAYLALLLTDEVSNDVEEYHEPAENQFREHLEHFLQSGQKNIFGRCPCLKEAPISEDMVISQPNWGRDFSSPEDTERLEKLLHVKKLQCYDLLVGSLFELGCQRSALMFCDRGLSMDGTCSLLQALRTRILESHPDGHPTPEIKDITDQGHSSREIYPWNEHEPDRFSLETLSTLNESLKQVAPRCEVRVTTLPSLSSPSSRGPNGDTSMNRQLGLFAKEDISSGEVFLREKSVLTATNRLHEPFCDACGRVLSKDNTTSADDPEAQVVPCDDCEDTLFCSPSCLNLAQKRYHSATCGHDRLDSIARDVPPEEASEALYLLLLGRALAMASAQEMHPLDLPELKYIWGDFSSSSSSSSSSGSMTDSTSSNETPGTKRLPFSFQMNIASPLHILEALDLDIYSSLSQLSDPWIFQTIYAKLRGTASAKMSSSSSSASSDIRTGITIPLPASFPRNDNISADQHRQDSTDEKKHSLRGTHEEDEQSKVTPEGNEKRKVVRIQPRTSNIGPNTAAVHPLWCLANHSCDPNVTWEWEDGEMRFWIPSRPLFDHDVRRSGGDPNGDGEGDDEKAGPVVMIKKGEEIFSHYCDVTLPFRERREWMMGCLGGECKCDRCLLEEKEDKRRQ